MKTGVIILIILGAVVGGYLLFRGEKSTVPTPTPSLIPVKSPSSASSEPSASSTLTPTSTPTPTETTTFAPTPTGIPSPTPVQQTYDILMQNRAFTPSAITITRGDLVVFTAMDTFYSITVGGRASGRLQPGQKWTFNSNDLAPGTYQMMDTTYSYMRGTMIIQ